jgi:hypothetical protein
MSSQIVFTTTDKKTPTLVYDEAYPSSHRAYFMKTPDNRVFAESRYRGDGVFAGKSYFELLGELNLPPKSNITDIAAFGRAIAAGTTKIIRKTRDNNIEMREIIYPGIYEDDELIWRNRKPEICCQCVYPETQGAMVECECDFCLAFL